MKKDPFNYFSAPKKEESTRNYNFFGIGISALLHNPFAKTGEKTIAST
jgi:hypothetical protein